MVERAGLAYAAGMPMLHALPDGGRLELLTGWVARDEADFLFVQLER